MQGYLGAHAGKHLRQTLTIGKCHAECSKRPFSKAAGESKPQAYPQGYVEDFDEPRTKLADFFSILLGGEFDEPQGIEVLVQPLLVHQLGMGTGFYEAPFVEDENPIGSLNSG